MLCQGAAEMRPPFCDGVKPAEGFGCTPSGTDLPLELQRKGAFFLTKSTKQHRGDPKRRVCTPAAAWVSRIAAITGITIRVAALQLLNPTAGFRHEAACL